MSSDDDTRPAGPPPGDVAPIESEPEGAEVEQPPAAADDPRPDELRSDTEGTGVDSPAPQQDEPAPTPGESPTAPPDALTDEAAPAPADIPVPAGDEPPTAESPEPTPPPFDERRSPIVERLCEKLGDAVVATEVLPGRDIWVRVKVDAWAETARVCREELGFTYFCFLSAIDWMPSPYGKSEDDIDPVRVDSNAPVEPGVGSASEQPDVERSLRSETMEPGVGSASEQPDVERSLRSETMEHGVTGGDTRFQLLARVESPGTGIGITLKADVGDDLVAPTWSKTYAGADWHERETWEMFGITFAGHPNLVHIYLPGEFEGFPLRKDFPLLSRMVKPWPGVVDIEPMPGEEPEDAEATEEVAE